MTSGPTPPARVFPAIAPLPEAPAEDRAQLHYDRDSDRLVGTLGDQPVDWHPVRNRHVSGRIGSVALEATWTSGNNYVPGPGRPLPRPGYVSDFPNIPADLTGSFGDLGAELHGVFHLDPDYAFRRGSVVGRVGAVHLEATVLAASGGLSDSRTVVVEGTYGPVPFEIYATIDGSLSQGILHGSIEGSTVHLDLARPPVQLNVEPGHRHLNIDRSQLDLSGRYHGPPELLALMVGALVKFI